jgi:hypothetical protein
MSGQLTYLLAAATSFPMVLLLWSVGYVPTHDGPEHLAVIALSRALQSGLPIAAQHLVANDPIAPQLHSWVVGALWPILGPVAAQKAYLTAYLISMPLSFAFLARSVGGRGLTAGLLGSLLAPGWPFFMGFFNFVAAVPMMLLAVGCWIRSEGGSRWRCSLILVALLPLIGVTHPFVLGVTGLACGLVTLRTPTFKRGPELFRLLLVCSPGLLLLILVALGALRAGEGGWLLTETTRLPVGQVLTGLALRAFGGPSNMTALLAVPFTAAVLLAVARLRPPDTGRDAVTALRWFGVLCLVGYLVAPMHITGWAFFQARFLWVGLAFIGATAVVGHGVVVRRIVPVLAVVVALIAAIPFQARYRAAAASVEVFAEGAGEVPSEELVLPLVFEAGLGSDDPYMLPMQLAGAYHTIERMALNPYHFAVHPSVHPVLYRDQGATLPDHPASHLWLEHACRPDEEAQACDRRRQDLYGRLVFLMRSYAATTVWAAPPGFLVELEQRSVEIAHQNGDALVVLPRPGAIRIDVGATPLPGVAIGVLRIGADSSAPVVGGFSGLVEADLSVEIQPVPAGDYHLEVFLDVDGDRRSGPADRGSSTDGGITFRVRSGQVTALNIGLPQQ